MAYSPLSGSGWPADDFLERKASHTSPTSPTRKAKPKPESPSSARLPPPSLFQGPPSRNASNISLHLAPGASAAAIGLPGSTSPSASSHPISPTSPDNLPRVPSRGPPDPKKNANLSPGAKSAASTVSSNRPFSRQTSEANAKRENDRADALWAEMQNTLAEVELSAANGSHIFGAGHAKALEELRMSQLALALAWARSEKDEVGSHAARDEEEKKDEIVGSPKAGTAGAKEKEKERDGKNGGKHQQQQQGQGSVGDGKEDEKERRKTLEEETENDILLARTRREANDRYFEQVNTTVVDVVRKLDEVAGAMRKVEKESRDIWSEEDDDDDDDDEDESGSVTGSTTGG